MKEPTDKSYTDRQRDRQTEKNRIKTDIERLYRFLRPLPIPEDPGLNPVIGNRPRYVGT